MFRWSENMKKLYIDFDGVILDSIKTTYDMMDEQGIDKYNPKEARAFYRVLDWNQALRDSHEINHSLDCIRQLIDSGQYEINILTHIVCYEEGVAKINYLHERIPELSVILVPKEFSKTEVVNAKDAILVDDYTENLKEWKEHGGVGIKFDDHARVHEFPVITSLSDITKLTSLS